MKSFFTLLFLLVVTPAHGQTLRADAIELPNGVRITSTPDGQVAIFERNKDGSYQNSTAWIPVKNPTGSHAPQTGHKFSRLDQDQVFVLNQFVIESQDPATGAGGVLARNFDYMGGGDMRADWPVHAAGGADEPYPTNYFGIDIATTDGALPFPNQNGPSQSTTMRVHLQTQPGETVGAFMARFAKHMDDQMRAQYGIGTQFPAKPTSPVNFAVTRESDRFSSAIRINLAVNQTRIQVVDIVQPSDVLDASPVITIKRRVPGRTPRPGDNMGQLTWGYADVGYAGLNANYGWPSPDYQAMIRNGNAYGTAYIFRYDPNQASWQQ